MARQAAAELNKQARDRLRRSEGFRYANLSILAMQQVAVSLNQVCGAAFLTEMWATECFKEMLKWMNEERPDDIDDLKLQMEYGHELRLKVYNLMNHRVSDKVPAHMTGEDEDRWRRAAAYADQVICDASGKKCFDWYWRCGGNLNGVGKCNSVSAAGAWKRKFADPFAKKQAWYCPRCNTKYKTSMGTFLEWRLDDESYCGLAGYPPHFVEEAGKNEALNGFRSQKWVIPGSPEDLLRAIPAIVPMSKALIQVAEGVYTFDPDYFDRIPVVGWS